MTINEVPPQTQEEWDEFHHQLDRLERDCGPNANKQQLAHVSIEACIIAGINTVGQIIKVLVPRGFSRGHIAAMLTKGKGGWLRRDAAGVLSLLTQ